MAPKVQQNLEHTKNKRNNQQQQIKVQKGKPAYKYEVQLNLDKLKKQEITNAKIDLTKINITTLTTKLDLLSNDVNIMMTLPSSNRHYAVNDRTINLLMKGKIDMDAVTDGVDAPKFSDAEISSLLEQDTAVLITVVKQMTQQQDLVVLSSHI